MAVKVRMTRKGNRGNPFYRVVVADERSPRDGRYIELIGTYDPLKDPAEIKLNHERIEYWKSHGAKFSDTVSGLIKKSAPAK